MDSGGSGEEVVKKRKKHRKHTLGKPGDETIHKNKYGFIEIENPEYLTIIIAFLRTSFSCARRRPRSGGRWW